VKGAHRTPPFTFHFSPFTLFTGAILLAGIAVAVIAIPIPIVHFILVPGSLTLGLIFAMLRLRQAEVFRSARGPCPFCGTEQSFTVMGRFQLPKDVICANCHRRLELRGGGA
jgi:hypothetical protein